MASKDVKDELSSGGAIRLNGVLFGGIMFIIKFIAPIAISVVLLNSLGLIKIF